MNTPSHWTLEHLPFPPPAPRGGMVLRGGTRGLKRLCAHLGPVELVQPAELPRRHLVMRLLGFWRH